MVGTRGIEPLTPTMSRYGALKKARHINDVLCPFRFICVTVLRAFRLCRFGGPVTPTSLTASRARVVAISALASSGKVPEVSP